MLYIINKICDNNVYLRHKKQHLIGVGGQNVIKNWWEAKQFDYKQKMNIWMQKEKNKANDANNNTKNASDYIFFNIQ